MENPERVEQLQNKVDQLVKVLEVAIDELRREGMHLTATSLNSFVDAILSDFTVVFHERKGRRKAT